MVELQFCLKLALLASLPANYGGLDGQVMYIDVESKFSSKRLLHFVTVSEDLLDSLTFI